jgi:hypothetical protein
MLDKAGYVRPQRLYVIVGSAIQQKYGNFSKQFTAEVIKSIVIWLSESIKP